MSRYYNDELYHSGRKGMKWYQHIYGAVKKGHDRRLRKQKEKAIRTRNLKKVRKLRKHMTDTEVKRAVERLRLDIELEQALKGKPPQQVQAQNGQKQSTQVSNGMAAVKSFTDKANTVNNAVSAVTKSYDNIKAVNKMVKEISNSLNKNTDPNKDKKNG